MIFPRTWKINANHPFPIQNKQTWTKSPCWNLAPLLFAQCVWREFCKCSVLVFSDLKHYLCGWKTKSTDRTKHRKGCFPKHPCTYGNHFSLSLSLPFMHQFSSLSIMYCQKYCMYLPGRVDISLCSISLHPTYTCYDSALCSF